MRLHSGVSRVPRSGRREVARFLAVGAFGVAVTSLSGCWCCERLYGTVVAGIPPRSFTFSHKNPSYSSTST